MKDHKEDLNQPEERNAASRVMGDAANAYRTMDQFFAVRDNDSLAVTIAKLAGRFLLILFMIILSPFLMIGLAIAFAAVF